MSAPSVATTRAGRLAVTLVLSAATAVAGPTAVSAASTPPATSHAVAAGPSVVSSPWARSGPSAQSSWSMRTGRGVTAAKPVVVRLGSVFSVRTGLRGITAGVRLALEVHSGMRWSAVGTVALQPGQTLWSGDLRAAGVGLFPLRFYLVRGTAVVPHSFGNVFAVQIVPVPVQSKRPSAASPRTAARGAAPGGAIPAPVKSPAGAGPADVKVPGWDNVFCGRYSDGGTTVLVAPPFQLHGQVDATVNQVVWAKDGVPGGTYGNWYVAATLETHVFDPDPGAFTVGLPDTYAGLVGPLPAITLNYTAETEFHKIAWDLQVYNATTNTWGYLDPTDFYVPEEYQQWSQSQPAGGPSLTCETFVL